MNVYNAVEWIRNIDLKSLPYKNIISITYGKKFKNGVATGEKGIVVGVEKKLTLEELQENDLLPIPPSVNINGVEVVTDVREFSLPMTFISDCHQGTTDYNPPEPIATNRKRTRVLKGGCSSIFIGENATDATLGMLVRDKTDRQVVALSNAHVYAASHLHHSLLRVNLNEGNYPGSSILYNLSASQPGKLLYNPYSGLTQDSDYIGNCKRTVVIGNDDPTISMVGSFTQRRAVNSTSCDAAILALSSYDLIDASSNSIIGFDIPGPYEFATDEEITSLEDENSLNYYAPMFRSGRTCGPVGAPGNSYSCSLSIGDPGFGIYEVGGYGKYTSFFKDCFILFGNNEIVPGRGGDSGSIIFAYLSAGTPQAKWKVVGILFAGPVVSFPSYSLCSRITSIVRDLDIIPWDGNIPTEVPTVTYERIWGTDLPSLTGATTLTLSGRKFYQMGIQYPHLLT